MTSGHELYFDHNSTTPVLEGIYASLRPLLTTEFGNPSSKSSELGKRAAETVATAREHVANFIGCRPDEVVFTGCGTEASFAAVVGAFRAQQEKRHIIISAVEHPAVVQAADFLRDLLEVKVSRIAVDKNGELDLNRLAEAIRPDTGLLSFMHANNETGVVFPVREIARIAKEHRVPVHTDAVPAAAYLPLDFTELGVDFLSLSAHKFGGIKGCGALIVRKGAPFEGVMKGGGQEDGRRGGTESVPLIFAMGEAARARRHQLRDGVMDRLQLIRNFFEDALTERVPNVSINAGRSERLPNTSSICFSGVVAHELIPVLAKRGIIASAGAACKTAAVEPSPVLRAMGLSTVDCLSTVRFSFGPDTTRETILHAVDILAETVAYFRADTQTQLQANFRG